MIINLISSPRNISTATMYSFANHGGFKVMDEPFYAYYLNLTGANHPGKEEIIQSQPKTVEGVIDWINITQSSSEHVFVKNMAHHMINMDLSFIKQYQNVLLIRNPKELITSFAKVIPNPKMSDIGVARQFEIYQYLDGDCLIIDSNETLKNPEAVFRQLFDGLGLEFSRTMLEWPAGPLPEDGIWARYWYNKVHESTHFASPKVRNEPFPEECIELLNEAMPIYDKLKLKALKADQ
ncbi:MAG: sulfotransferase family protein [Flammeovirgaceae bacterium]|nr:sulfotransferase family protein [Flammeovirgaceae bacterium]HCX20746.1 sulfotransferase family protein [Cytophagales bacterium]